MLNSEETHGKAPETGPGSSEKPKVNTLLVENFVSLLAAFSIAERHAIYEAIRSLPEFDGYKSKKPPIPPMMNDGLEERKPGGITSSQAIAFTVRLEPIFKKSGNGGYDWRTANRAAWNFLSKHDEMDVQRLLSFVEDHHSSLVGRLFVSPSMFDGLWTHMIQSGG